MDKDQRMLLNFIEKYGEEKLTIICSMFKKQESNQIIASHFGVTRQRVHQWQCSFTTKSVTIRPHVSRALLSDTSNNS